MELKPCPFCGSDKVFFTEDEEQLMENTTTGLIWCRGCGFSSDSFYDEYTAAEHWNQRVSEYDMVKHGKWIAEHLESRTPSARNRRIKYRRFMCSECFASNGRHNSRYCPHCGAKMDLKGGNENENH